MLTFTVQSKQYKLHAFMIDLSTPPPSKTTRKIVFQQNKQTLEWYLFVDRIMTKVDVSEVQELMKMANNKVYLMSYYEELLFKQFQDILLKILSGSQTVQRG